MGIIYVKGINIVPISSSAVLGNESLYYNSSIQYVCTLRFAIVCVLVSIILTL